MLLLLAACGSSEAPAPVVVSMPAATQSAAPAASTSEPPEPPPRCVAQCRKHSPRSMCTFCRSHQMGAPRGEFTEWAERCSQICESEWDACIQQCEVASCGSAAAKPGEVAYGFLVDQTCRYVVYKPSQCWPGSCAIRITAVRGNENWTGTCTATKAGDFHFDVISGDRRRATFMMSLGRPDASLDIGDGKIWISGRLLALAP